MFFHFLRFSNGQLSFDIYLIEKVYQEMHYSCFICIYVFRLGIGSWLTNKIFLFLVGLLQNDCICLLVLDYLRVSIYLGPVYLSLH